MAAPAVVGVKVAVVDGTVVVKTSFVKFAATLPSMILRDVLLLVSSLSSCNVALFSLGTELLS